MEPKNYIGPGLGKLKGLLCRKSSRPNSVNTTELDGRMKFFGMNPADQIVIVSTPNMVGFAGLSGLLFYSDKSGGEWVIKVFTLITHSHPYLSE